MDQRHLQRTLMAVFVMALLAACAAPAATVAPTQPAATTVPTQAAATSAATQAAAATSAPAATTSASGPVTIRVITQFAVGAEPQPTLDKIAAEFNQENPNIHVVFDWSGGADFMKKYQAQLAAGTPYDILWQNEGTAAVLARQGVSANITQYLDGKNYDGTSTWKDTFIPSILQRAYVSDGQDGAGYYAIPDEQFIGGIWYNKAIFTKYNIQIPQTWDQLLAVCDTLKSNGLDCISADGGVTSYNSFWFSYLAMRQVGCDVFHDTAMGKAGTTFNTPDFTTVAQDVATLHDKNYLMKGYQGSAWPAAQMEFVQSKTGLMLMNSWLPGEMLSSAPKDFPYGFFAFPSLAGSKADQTTVQLKFNGYIVTKAAPHHDEAIQFIKKLLSKKAEESYAAASWYPGVLPGLTLPGPLADTAPVLQNAKTVAGFTCGLDGDAPEWESNVLEPLDDKLFFGQMTPTDFITQLQSQTTSYWASKK